MMGLCWVKILDILTLNESVFQTLGTLLSNVWESAIKEHPPKARHATEYESRLVTLC